MTEQEYLELIHQDMKELGLWLRELTEELKFLHGKNSS